MAKLVWGFDFLPPIDPASGKEVPRAQIDSEVATAYTDGVSTGPKPFRCRIIPRSAKHLEIIKRDFLDAQVVFDHYHTE
jgi:hypothetical protein